MKKRIAEVYEEDDYSVFRKLPENRDVTSNRVAKLIASMTEKYIFNPIIVNEKMEVIDGQGRFEARKEMGLPIHYIISPGATKDDCIRMNKYNTTWKSMDIAKSHAKGGIEAYKLLLKTLEKVGFGIELVLRLCNRGSTSRNAKNEGFKMTPFETGKLVFTENDIDVVQNCKRIGTDIIDALQFTSRTNEVFWISVKIMSEYPGYNHEHMLKNCMKNRASFTQASTINMQLKEFERIYNKGTSNAKKVYFSDFMRNKGSNVRDYRNTHIDYKDNDVSSLKGVSDGN